MQKLFHLSPQVVEQLRDLAENNNTTQSKIVESAIVMYLVLFKGVKVMKDTAEGLPVGQMSLFDKAVKEGKGLKG